MAYCKCFFSTACKKTAKAITINIGQLLLVKIIVFLNLSIKIVCLEIRNI